MVNYKIKKDESSKKRKIIVLIGIVVLILTAIILTVILWPKGNRGDKDVIINTGTNLKNVNGKLATYIENLGDKYYIKYTGKFGNKKLNDTLVEASVEYTKKDKKTAIYSKELNMHVIIDGEDSINILHNQKLIIKSKLPVRFNTEPYNLVSDFGQKYVNDVETTIDGVKYIYQEYTYDNSIIRYYFLGDELSYIRIIVGKNDRKINIRKETKVKEELFNIPQDYTNYN